MGDPWGGSTRSIPQPLTRPHTWRGKVQAAQVGAQVEAPLAPLAFVPRQELAQLTVVEALPGAQAINPRGRGAWLHIQYELGFWHCDTTNRRCLPACFPGEGSAVR